MNNNNNDITSVDDIFGIGNGENFGNVSDMGAGITGTFENSANPSNSFNNATPVNQSNKELEPVINNSDNNGMLFNQVNVANNVNGNEDIFNSAPSSMNSNTNGNQEFQNNSQIVQSSSSIVQNDVPNFQNNVLGTQSVNDASSVNNNVMMNNAANSGNFGDNTNSFVNNNVNSLSNQENFNNNITCLDNQINFVPNDSTTNLENNNSNQISEVNNNSLDNNNGTNLVNPESVFTVNDNVLNNQGGTVSSNNDLEINQNSTNNNQSGDVNKQSNSVNVSDDDLIEAFVGKKYDKIKNNKFNFWGFLFGPLYLTYRKMPGYAACLFVIEAVITYLFKLLGLNLLLRVLIGLVMMIIVGVFVNKFYLQEVSKKVNKIKTENSNSNGEVLLTICKFMGGTSKVLLALGMYIMGTVTTIVLVIGMITGTINFFKNIPNNGNWSSSDTNKNQDNSDTKDDTSLDEENYTFDGGISYNTSVNINSLFNVTIPAGFEEDTFWGSKDYHLNYELSSSTAFGDCSLELFSPLGYKNAKGLAQAMRDYYNKNSDTSEVLEENRNNITWYNFSVTGSFSTDYYYLMNKDNKVFVYSYESGKYNLNVCNSYKDTVLNSISIR